MAKSTVALRHVVFCRVGSTDENVRMLDLPSNMLTLHDYCLEATKACENCHSFLDVPGLAQRALCSLVVRAGLTRTCCGARSRHFEVRGRNPLPYGKIPRDHCG